MTRHYMQFKNADSLDLVLVSIKEHPCVINMRYWYIIVNNICCKISVLLVFGSIILTLQFENIILIAWYLNQQDKYEEHQAITGLQVNDVTPLASLKLSFFTLNRKNKTVYIRCAWTCTNFTLRGINGINEI